MWFKNLRIYRFTQAFNIDVDALHCALETMAFVPCNSQDVSRFGWVSPITGESDGGDNHCLVHASQQYMMICAKKQEKVLPATVVNERVEEKATAITEAEGRPVGRKERQSLKDDATMELLPRAFTRSSLQFAYIAPPTAGNTGYIVINAASASKAEELLGALRDALGTLPVVPLASKQLPHQMMTQWLTDTSAPEKFTLGDECELADPKEAGSVIRCKHQDLATEEINNLLQSGMIATKLHLQWMQGVDFILDDQLAIKRLRFDDNIQEKADSFDTESTIEQFDIEFSVMTIELSAFINDLTKALGGISTDGPSVEEIIARTEKIEPTHTHVDEVSFE